MYITKPFYEVISENFQHLNRSQPKTNTPRQESPHFTSSFRSSQPLHTWHHTSRGGQHPPVDPPGGEVSLFDVDVEVSFNGWDPRPNG